MGGGQKILKIIYESLILQIYNRARNRKAIFWLLPAMLIKSGVPITAALIADILVFLMFFFVQFDFYDFFFVLNFGYICSRLRSARWSILFMPEQQSWAAI